MNVHEFGMTIRENKDLYTEQEYEDLCNQWQKEYYEYLIKKYYKTQLRKQREVSNLSTFLLKLHF